MADIRIRAFRRDDIEAVMKLWLSGNIQAHDFISEQYWMDNYSFVKHLLPSAELYVYEGASEGDLDGFIGLNDGFVEGIFVKESKRSRGIGAGLLDFIKEKNSSLALKVYCKNERAVRFYLKQGFRIQTEERDENTGEPEYRMAWTNILQKN